MHRHHVLEIELLQLRHDLAQVVVWRWRQMEPADQCVNLLDAGYLLCMPQRIDNPGMTARTDNDQATVAETEAGGMLVPMVMIGLRFDDELLGCEVMVHAGLASHPRQSLMPIST